jgi:hypothetical protein
VNYEIKIGIMKSCNHRIIFLSAFLIFLPAIGLLAQNELDVIKNNWIQYSDAPNSLYHHITEQAYALLAQRNVEIARLKSLTDWQQRQKVIHETLLDIIGPFPEKTPLNAKIVRIVKKDSFRIEHIVYESQPGFHVTSSLFIPGGLNKNSKSPVIIYCSGHSAEGYRNKVYLHVILNLVKKGFMVFAFDPIGQGERLEYYDPITKKSKFDGPTAEHSYVGTQTFITGSSLARFMIWDGIRAIDYLVSRKDVDIDRIGITGRSGGGTQCAYIAAMDNRIKAAAPEDYITNFTRLLQTIGPQDAEQNFYHGILRGIDHPDLLLVRAPKPTLMITTTRDFFSIQGSKETEKEVSAIYKAYGKPENFKRVEDDIDHASTQKNREAMYGFFQKSFNISGNSNDEELIILTPEEMQVTLTGQVSTSYKGETVFSLNCKDAHMLVEKLQSSRNDLMKHIPEVLLSAKKLSGYLEPSGIKEPIFTGRFQREGYSIEKYFLKGEGDYVIPYLLMIPQKSNSKAIIYLHPSGKSSEANIGGEIEWFVKQGYTVLAPDMIGIGETGPGIFNGDSSIEGISYNTWYASMLIGRSIVGIRAGDVVRLSRLLKRNSGINEVYGFAKKELSAVLLYAAAFDSTIRRVVLIEPPSSYLEIVMNNYYNPRFVHSLVPGALETYDLPDLAGSLAPRKLLIIDTKDGSGSNTDNISINKDLDIIRTIYHYRNADRFLNIVSLKKNETQYNFFIDWLKPAIE